MAARLMASAPRRHRSQLRFAFPSRAAGGRHPPATGLEAARRWRPPSALHSVSERRRARRTLEIGLAAIRLAAARQGASTSIGGKGENPALGLDAYMHFARSVDGQVANGEFQPTDLRGEETVGVEELLEGRPRNVGADQVDVGFARQLHLAAGEVGSPPATPCRRRRLASRASRSRFPSRKNA